MTAEFRALSIGDSHIEEGPRFGECIRVHDDFVDKVEREKPHAVFHVGDVHERGSTPLEREYTSSFLRRCADVCPVFVVKGNHDRGGDLLIMAKLKAHHKITVCETAEVVGVGFGGSVAHIWMMAWPVRASALDEEGSRQAIRNVLAGIGAEFDVWSGPRVLIGHFDISGAKVGAKGQPLIGGALTVTLADLALARAHVTVAGHIHKAQDFTHDGRSFLYGGSPFRTDAGETEAKSFLELRITEQGLVTWTRLPSPARAWHLIEGVWVRTPDGVAGWESIDVAPEMAGADVRFHYTREPQEQDAADRAANELRDRWLSFGAATVALDKELVATTRARVPEISTAVSLEDKLDVLWTAQGRQPAPEVRSRLFGRLGFLDAFGTKWQAHPVRYGRLQAKGLGFRNEIDIDLDAIPGPLVAVTGPNGSCKSIVMELFSAALDRTMPTRGSLVELAKLTGDRTAYLQVGLTNGQAWTVRHDVDGVSGKSEASMLDADGVEVLPDRKVSSFDVVSAKTFPPPEVRMASTVRAQKSPGFLSLKPAERRGIVLRAIGVEALEGMATQARDFARVAKGELDSLDARLGDERRRVGGGTVDVADMALTNARTTLDHAFASAEAANRRLAQVRAEAARVTEANADRDRRAAALLSAQEQIRKAEADAQLLAQRVVESRKAIEGLEEARAASIRCEELRADIATHNMAIAAMPFAELRAKKDAALNTAQAARRQTASLQNAIGQAKAQASALEAARSECAKLEGADERFKSASERCEALRVKLDETKAAQLGAAEGRIGGLREHLSGIADRRWGDPRQAAVHGLLADDREVEAQKDRPDAIEHMSAKLAALSAETATLGTANVQFMQARTRLDALSKEPNRLEELEAELAHLTAWIAQHECIALDASVRIEQVSQEKATAEYGIGVATEELRSLAPMVDRLAGAVAAETRVALDEEALGKANQDLATLLVAWEGTDKVIPEASVLPDVLGAEGAERSAQGILGDAKVAVALRERELAEVAAAAGRIAELEAKRASADVDCSDWARLAADLGRDGLQNLAVDSAGPQLTALTNDLLHSCVGPRWTVALETQRASADGKRTLEGFGVRVFDAQENREVLGERLCGGEMCIVDEALSLALTMYACPPTGSEGATILRDESGSALDVENGRAYIKMLRKAAHHTRASKVLFISHVPDLHGLADSRIAMSRGVLQVLPT